MSIYSSKEPHAKNMEGAADDSARKSSISADSRTTPSTLLSSSRRWVGKSRYSWDPAESFKSLRTTKRKISDPKAVRSDLGRNSEGIRPFSGAQGRKFLQLLQGAAAFLLFP
ncbi:hypothetical protein CDAR_496331 [Caerostris darwini]|uniref:Uncharacterized protein n=1 Tax=Caerostris darwini TaxID=1538125 RepID=A0AAV4MVS5_9ARAC|nr:hypothetical protein CDAR_496331 [Caerostris darwini]